MPAYMAQFRCKCGDCRAVCCRGWRINLTKTEYLRLTATDCSDALRTRIAQSLTVATAPTDDAFAYITHGENGRCPMLDQAGLCSLQTELGWEMQPAVCRLYPRAVRAGETCEIVAADSCEATVELLMAEPSPLPFTTVTGEISADIPPHEVMHEDDRALRARCLALLGETDKPLSERIASIGEALGVSEATPITDREILSLARTLLLAFGREGNSISDLAAEAMDALNMRDGADGKSLRLFGEALTRFHAHFPDAERWYGNLLANHFFFMQFPQRDLSRAEAYTAMRAAAALLFVLTVCHCDKTPTHAAFADAAAAVFRRIEHSNFYEITPHLLGI